VQEGVGAQLAAGVQLDAAAAAVAAIRTKLPYIDARELVCENVKYSFITPLVTLNGSGDYLRVMSHWRQTVPQRLGVGWKVRHPQRAFCTAAAPRPALEHGWSAHPKSDTRVRGVRHSPARCPAGAVGDCAHLPARRTHAGCAVAHDVDSEPVWRAAVG
jgi:hypothetical protein